MKYKVETLEVTTTKTGKRVANCVMVDEQGNQYDKKISIWADFPSFETITFGQIVEGDIVVNDKGYATLYPPKPKVTPRGSFGASGGMSKLMDKKSESIKQAQERKSESIAYFNSVNSAIALLNVKHDTINMPEDKVREFVVRWRDWFISEYEKWDSDPGVPFK